MWEIENKLLYAILSGHVNAILKFAITNDDENFVSGNFSDGIHVWNIGTKKQIFYSST